MAHAPERARRKEFVRPGRDAHRNCRYLRLYTAAGEHIHREVAPAGHRPLTALVGRSSLEGVFLRFTGRSLAE